MTTHKATTKPQPHAVRLLDAPEINAQLQRLVVLDPVRLTLPQLLRHPLFDSGLQMDILPCNWLPVLPTTPPDAYCRFRLRLWTATRHDVVVHGLLRPPSRGDEAIYGLALHRCKIAYRVDTGMARYQLLGWPSTAVMSAVRALCNKFVPQLRQAQRRICKIKGKATP